VREEDHLPKTTEITARQEDAHSHAMGEMAG
jgi:hypothetical protein